MELMGEPKPEKMTAGMMKKKADTMACCCVAETVEMKRPIPSIQNRKRTVPSAKTPVPSSPPGLLERRHPGAGAGVGPALSGSYLSDWGSERFLGDFWFSSDTN